MNIKNLYQDFIASSGICTDTRKITPNCLFFALRGENFNANTFTQEAIEKGAYKVVIDDLQYHQNTGKTVLCKNTLMTLQKLASYHREQLGVPIISLTGSNGKTTSKELINAVLSEKYRTTATVGNLNNHIGVPLTLLSMNTETEIGIVEMGANHLKEIEALSNMAMPDYGYITNFGKAHLEGFGSLEGVVQGKSELYKHLFQHKKKVFVNGNDHKQMQLTQSMSRIVFGTDEHEHHISLLEASDTLKIKFKNVEIQSNLIGLYNFHNIAAAIAIGAFFDVSIASIKKAIEGYIPSNNRSQIIEKNGHTIILDAYNANPTSMMAALENFKQSKGANKCMFLGDMFELGNTAATEHEAMAVYLKKHNFGNVYLVGKNFSATETEGKNITKFENFNELKAMLISEKIVNANILIKGSRGMALERVLELL